MFVPNQILNNRYRVIEKIGKGSMGIVFLAEDAQFNDKVAIKVNILNDKWKQAFENEAKLLNKLRHIGLPQVRGYFSEGITQCLVMEYIDGRSLSEKIEDYKSIGQKGLPFEAFYDITNQLCEIVIYLHSQEIPIIHRDIKPENIKQMTDGRIILLDFGISKDETTHVQGGTPAYSSIEQSLLSKTDQRSDMYSIGATVYHLISGEMPIPAKFRNETNDELKELVQVRSDISPDVSNLVSWAMKYRAESRPQSVNDFFVEWNRVLKGHLHRFDDRKVNVFSSPINSPQVKHESFEADASKATTIPSFNENEAKVVTEKNLNPDAYNSGLTQPSPLLIDDQPANLFEKKGSFETTISDYEHKSETFDPSKNRHSNLRKILVWAVILVGLTFFAVIGLLIVKFSISLGEGQILVANEPEPKSIDSNSVANSFTTSVNSNNSSIEPTPQLANLPIPTPTPSVDRMTFSARTYLRKSNTLVDLEHDFKFSDEIYFNIDAGNDGYLYVLVNDTGNNLLSLFYLKDLMHGSSFVISKNKPIMFPPRQVHLPVGYKTGIYSKFFFVVSSTKSDELVSEILATLPEGKDMSLETKEVKSLYEKLETLAVNSMDKSATESPLNELRFSSSTGSVVGSISIKTDGK